jgi:hypothetical protein
MYIIRHNADSLSSVILDRSQVFTLLSVEKLFSAGAEIILYYIVYTRRVYCVGHWTLMRYPIANSRCDAQHYYLFIE